MVKIGLISDTHSFLDPKIFEHFASCHEIWHAGDFGSIEVAKALENFKPLRAVYGNIDGHEIRKIHPLDNEFVCEGLKVWITHIGGYPGSYPPYIKTSLLNKRPGLFICGHSHILRVMRDNSMGKMIHINPGAAGKEGFHKVRTVVRFEINRGEIENLDVIELGLRGALQ